MENKLSGCHSLKEEWRRRKNTGGHKGGMCSDRIALYPYKAIHVIKVRTTYTHLVPM